MAVAVSRTRPLPPAVVVAVDDLELRARLRDTLAGDGYRILAIGSHDEARWLVEHDDIALVISDAIELVASVRRTSPQTLRIVLATNPSLDSAMRAINDAHAHRYVTGPMQPEQLRGTIRDALASTKPSPALQLSPRLRDTLDALMTGASEKQIASELGISHHTAHEYVKALYRRFGVTSRPELMATVLRHGAVSTTS